MKTSDINLILDKFCKSSDRAIIIDGVWGVGKTYGVNEFLKGKKKDKNCVIAYVSLFGKSSVDEIHTEIYSRYHPHKVRARTAINMIPKVASLFSDAPTVGGVASIIGGLDYTLKVPDANKKHFNRKSKKTRLLFLDDFERLDFSKISFNDIMGYINSLIMQEIKIVVLCNASEIGETEFQKFKEKVFDREYRISAINEEVIFSCFKDAPELDYHIISQFDGNLRLASRTSTFYSEVIQLCKSKKLSYQEIFSDKTLLCNCAYVVVAANSTKYRLPQNEGGGRAVVLESLSAGRDAGRRNNSRTHKRYHKIF